MDAFFDAACSAAPELSGALRTLSELHAHKQWHQLTVALLAFALDPLSSRGTNLVELYERFIATCESWLDQLSLVRIVAAAAAQLARSRPAVLGELDAAASFLTAALGEKRARLGRAGALVLDMELAVFGVRRAGALAAAGDAAGATAALDAAKVSVRTGEAELEALREGEEPAVAASVHRAASEYYKLRGPAASFYTSALRFLGCTNLDALSVGERHALAVDVALAALVGEGVFNFGEVCGSIDTFNTLAGEHGAAIAAQPALLAASGALKEKVTLLAVMEMAARRPAGARFLSFSDISAETRLPLEQVEWVAMRAMSLGLIKGSIDQVDQVVNVTFVKPRVLNLDQVRALKEQVDSWRDKAEATMQFVDARGHELWQG